MSSTGISLQWVRSFVTTARDGSMTAAAETLHLAQPRITAHIRSLEQHLNVTLFTRRPDGVRLTAAGLTFLPYAERSLEELQTGVDEVDAARDVLRGRIRMGSYPGANAVIIAPMLQRFSALFPEVGFELLEADSRALAQALRRGEIEWAIVADLDAESSEGLSLARLCTERVVLVEPDHRAGTVPPEQVIQNTRRVLVSGDASHGLADYRESFAQLDVLQDHLQITQLPTTLVALVRAGLGVGVLGAFAASASAQSQVTTRPLPVQPWSRVVSVATRIGTPLPPASAEFVRRLVDDLDQFASGMTVESTPPETQVCQPGVETL